jgi:glycosyltransferase involved in cell wall biosynthesis
MRLCFIGDPRAVHTQRWVNWFAARHEVTLIATAEDDALKEFRICSLPSVRARRGTRLWSSTRAVRSVLSEHRPDVLHAHFINESGWFAAAAGFRPVVVTAWGSDVYRAPAESPLARRLNPWAVRRADWVTCDSTDQARVLRSWGVSQNRLSVINWGVDRHAFHPGVSGHTMRARLSIPVQARVILSPRQWLPNSNIEAVIDAHARLPSDVYLVLKRLPRFERGAGRVIEEAIAQSPQRERIRVLGEIEEHELPALYVAADVVVSLCGTDGTPVSLLEAMATGRPVVALANESIDEWVSAPGGRTVSSPRVDEVLDALQHYLSDPALRERSAAHNMRIVAARADRTMQMTLMDDVYARLLEMGRGRNSRRAG